jgi:hypothetical protein
MRATTLTCEFADDSTHCACRCDLELSEGGRYPGLYILTAHANPAVRALVGPAPSTSQSIKLALSKLATRCGFLPKSELDSDGLHVALIDHLRWCASGQVAADIERLGPFSSTADLEPVMSVLQRWTHLLEFDLFHSQSAQEGRRKA